MKFKEDSKTVYCKDNSYRREFDKNSCNYNMQYYKGYLIHREDGPAIEWVDGDKEWFKDGKRHRINGPALKFSNGDKYWYLEGKHHREDGPAIEYENGYKRWYLNGRRYSEEKYLKIMNLKNKKKVLNEI